MSKRFWFGLFSLFLAVAAAFALYSAWAPIPTEAQGQGPYSYPVKFVCGFNNSNLGPATPPSFTPKSGESIVKLGNYATDINIYNPFINDSETANIRKKLLLLAKADPDFPSGFEPYHREPSVADPIEDGEVVVLRPMQATMDDCNELYRRAGMPNPPAPAPLMIGFLVLVSDVPLDVTAVYTSEICADWIQAPMNGATFQCSKVSPGTNGGFWGAGMSIDVEQIKGRDLSNIVAP